ncbi:hypothetical protein HYH03_000348 [Edaphochlamys debaryana]|uniref:Uncharacterized protein n=1 Tax=Edaphochlamys debaryana TaxID=47281 RepID=A0A836C6F0_9CHLO|nr:hypothetical protein HYH03_000348 [Edaphochlamys debaryana]|eukprot:KAG2501850.1 hypothetical protein HYH03_000348 [Edaphochlamys debaryana]
MASGPRPTSAASAARRQDAIELCSEALELLNSSAAAALPLAAASARPGGVIGDAEREAARALMVAIARTEAAGVRWEATCGLYLRPGGAPPQRSLAALQSAPPLLRGLCSTAAKALRSLTALRTAVEAAAAQPRPAADGDSSAGSAAPAPAGGGGGGGGGLGGGGTGGSNAGLWLYPTALGAAKTVAMFHGGSGGDSGSASGSGSDSSSSSSSSSSSGSGSGSGSGNGSGSGSSPEDVLGLFVTAAKALRGSLAALEVGNLSAAELPYEVMSMLAGMDLPSRVSQILMGSLGLASNLPLEVASPDSGVAALMDELPPGGAARAELAEAAALSLAALVRAPLMLATATGTAATATGRARAGPEWRFMRGKICGFVLEGLAAWAPGLSGGVLNQLRADAVWVELASEVEGVRWNARSARDTREAVLPNAGALRWAGEEGRAIG